MSMLFMSSSQNSEKKDKDNQKYFSFRKQYTFYERERERERNDRISIKSLIQNVKLKTRIRNLIDKLPSRRFHKLEEYHYNLIGDLSEKQVNAIQDKQNNSNFEVPVFIHEAQASQVRKLKKLQSLMNKQQQQTSAMLILRGIQENFNLNCIKQTILFTFGNFPIIDPNSIWKLIWDFFMCIKIFILCFICSVRITDIYDSISTYADNNYTLMVAFIILQSLDMVLCANTGYYQRGRLVKTREDIIKKYIVKNGFIDILTLQALIFELHRWNLKLGQDQSFSSYTSSYQIYVIVCILEAIILLLYFIKGMRITKLLTKLEEQFQVTRKQLNLLQLVKLLVFVLIVSHIFACVWLFVGKNSGFSVTWITAYKLENQLWSTQYIRAQYYASVTMITVGYGDTVPQNDTEKIICMIGMMLTCGVFAYAINSIGSILNELNLENAKRKENMLVISQYMREKNIQRNLQSEIREYLEYYWKEWNEAQIEKEQQIISQLSDHLRKELLFQANRTIIHEKSLLTHYFSDFFIQKIIHIIKELKATPNQTIVCNQGPESRKGVVFFVEKGEFDIYHFPMSNIINQDSNNNSENNQMLDQNKANQNNNPQHLQFAQNQKQLDQQNFTILKKIKTIGVGESFGFESFFTDNPHKFVVKSKDFCKLLYIDRQDFIDLMRQHSLQEDYEKFCFIRDSLINDNNLTLLETKCQSCKKFDHSLNDCQYIHYTPNKFNLVSRFNISVDIIERSNKNERWPKKRHRNSLKNIVYYSELALEYIQKNSDYIENILNYEDYSFVSSFSDYSDDNYENEQSNQSDITEENKYKTDEIQDKDDESNISFGKDQRLSDLDANSNSEHSKRELAIDIQKLNNEAKHNNYDGYAEDSAAKKKMSIRDQSFHIKSPESYSYKKASFSKQTFNSEKTNSVTDEISPTNNNRIRYSQLNLNSSRSREKTINDPILIPNNIIRQSKHEIELKDSIQKMQASVIQEGQREKRASQIIKIQKRLILNPNTGNSTSIPRKSILYNQAFCFAPNVKTHQTSKDQNNIANQQYPHSKNVVFNFPQNSEQKQQMPLIIKHIESIHNQQSKQDNSKFKSIQNNEQTFSLNNQAEGKKSEFGSQQNDQYPPPKQNNELTVIKEGSNRCIKKKEIQQQDIAQIQNQQQNEYDQQQQFYFQGYQNYKIFDDFENMHQFKFYYPQYNYDKIIANLKKRRAQILQRQINNTNKLEMEQSFIQPNQSSKLQKKLKLQLGITKTISKFQNQVQQSKFFENAALKQSFQESLQTQGSQKKKSIVVNSPVYFNSQQNINSQIYATSPMNNNQNEVVSICASNKNNLNNEHKITSSERLNYQNINDDYDFSKNDVQLQKLTQNVNINSQNDTHKNSIFNVKFAPLITKINSNQKISFQKPGFILIKSIAKNDD